MKQKLTVMLVDDHKIFREGLVSLIQTEGIAEVIGQAESGTEFIKLIKENVPDLVIMDISMPKMNGIDATIKAIKKNPELKILALSSFADKDYFDDMIDAGAKGFILKNTGIDELKKAIEAVAAGGTYYAESLLAFANSPKRAPRKKLLFQLTPREKDVLLELCRGFTTREIAEKLLITSETVKGHRSNILIKTNCKNAAELVLYTVKNRLVKL